ncbi:MULTISPECIES: hypothetical protein [unclassified Paenibacillus]|uniref:hypothetical protein n=1 Tax=unclassified Paenibacillus TaxID=185978 RepID=UPI001B7CC441|nr:MULTISPECIES: hypothetical protein [unclassified Paenibacillus]MBP1155473.1 transposase InsO family protein [Paenibacillus sp. PvP091]MBP1169142.1 transposase InsO family protein [Paenibacillus sp. PvR098]MBP2440170.1 transposase InsO family protein [Paenibacillus sp. PvP052]
MQILEIRSRIRRKHRCNYASSTGERVAKNLLNRRIQYRRANQKWVTDVTQYRRGKMTLSLAD